VALACGNRRSLSEPSEIAKMSLLGSPIRLFSENATIIGRIHRNANQITIDAILHFFFRVGLFLPIFVLKSLICVKIEPKSDTHVQKCNRY
jgi:hypothetical protein